MIDAPSYPNEEQRLNSLRKTRLLDTPIEERFEKLTRMVCRLMDVPVALFNLIDDKRQFYKSAQGVNTTNAPLEGAFCPHAFSGADMLLIPDAEKDKRFFDNPFVTGKFAHVRFYAGYPVKTPDGMPIGTLCAIDMKPREMTQEQLAALRDIAAMVETELRLAFVQQEKQELEGELEQATRLAMIDPLTRLWNRAGMEKLLSKAWAEARRHAKPVTLVMCDIDYFKKLNDTYGHDVGDDVLRNVAKKLLQGLRSEDCVFRIGGEEFLMLLPNCELENALQTLGRIRKLIEETEFSQTKLAQPVTMSFGVATAVPQDGLEPQVVIKKADVALYEAKNSGRNRVVAARD